MFEDLDQKNGQNLSGKPVYQGGDKGVSAPVAPKVEDMFAGVKDIGTPKAKVAGAATAMPKNFSTKKPSSNVLRNLIIVIIVLIVLAGGLFLAGRFFGITELNKVSENIINLKSLILKESAPGQTIIVNEEVPADIENDNIVQETPVQNIQETPVQNIPVETAPIVNAPIVSTSTNNISTSSNPAVVASTTPATTSAPIVSTDTDGDGLTDLEEKTLGTNPLKVDTDADGLTDFQEVKTYLTNPLTADTDGDTYLDGAEVQSGYNPNGAGKLVTSTSSAKSL